MSEVVVPYLNWFEVSNFSAAGIELIFLGPYGVPHVCYWRTPDDIAACLISWDHPKFNHNVNEIDMAPHYIHLDLVDPRAQPLTELFFG